MALFFEEMENSVGKFIYFQVYQILIYLTMNLPAFWVIFRPRREAENSRGPKSSGVLLKS